jgi:uncharacterized protein (UPF0276 family)
MGFDLPWGGKVGFTVDSEGRERISARLRAFLAAGKGPDADHLFFSWQPRDRGRLRLADYAPAWDDLALALPPGVPRALHHTALNLASSEREPAGRGELLDFTNALCERYRLGWINEDLGFWSIADRPLPYPLPPFLDAAGLAASVRNVRACQRALAVPLVIEFPGFAAGVSLVLGQMDAYDFFRRVAEETGAPVNLDIAHLLSWRWWRGLRGEALYDDLEALPLSACFEIHLSGCAIEEDRFIDAHHGRLLPEQLRMLERLLPFCPNLRAVTFEDPEIAEDGALAEASGVSLAHLQRVLCDWRGVNRKQSTPPPAIGRERVAAGDLSGTQEDEEQAAREATLAALLFDGEARSIWQRQAALSQPFASLDRDALEETAAAVRRMVRARSHRGTGRLVEQFPLSIAGWRTLHPQDADLDQLFGRFLASPAAASWRERPGGEPGACLEACFAQFARAEAFADPLTVEEELSSALLRTLAVTPDPSFVPPPLVRRGARGWFAVTSGDPPILHAAIDGHYLRGPVTSLIASLLGGASISAAAGAHGVAPVAATAIHARLCEMGFLA